MPKTVAFPRHAASLILWRSRAGGEIEILMGLRHAGHRFMPSRLVFPGGRVDFGDRTAPAATEPLPATLAALERAAPPRLARALAMAAARELEEETGLTLAPPGQAAPALDVLDYVCRAVTPASMSMRFNARFLSAPAEAARGSLAGCGELERIDWFTLEEAAGAPLAPITARVLEQFAACMALPPAQRAARPLICFQGHDRMLPERQSAPARRPASRVG
ncbi:NUDIX domain-containing protein [Roseomonas marmotae]|uniref:NUDIX hydrolase n=1 Tax=Roseomonas marmotae TaxID=2768161 RepID=A0ABS3KDR0_9PROT|nr:NUDIX hydrolase [Roseomonas marmotae]MBO1075607.1 NUDIX hydrolase [Roseomonas marmotae]QTI79469.1 NUDIX hydrolase [Roseomonas marmotae]